MSDSVKTACNYCSGYGIVHDDLGNEVPCSECNGTGIKWVEDEELENIDPIDIPDVLPTDK